MEYINSKNEKEREIHISLARVVVLVRLGLKHTFLEQWTKYALVTVKLDLDRGVQVITRQPRVLAELIVSKEGVSAPTARDAERFIDFQLSERKEPQVSEEKPLPLETLKRERANSIQWHGWKPSAKTIPLSKLYPETVTETTETAKSETKSLF